MKKTFKEFLKPAGLSEEGNLCLVSHHGALYKLDRIFELTIDLPVTKLKLDTIKFVVSGEPDQKKVEAANKNQPIIVTPVAGSSGYYIIDGYNRVLKAIKDGDHEIQARIAFHDVLAMSRFGSGPSVAFASNVGDQNPYVNESADAPKILKLDLNKGKSSGDKTLLDRMKEDQVDFMDFDYLEKDSEGNVEGQFEIWLKDGSQIHIDGESFSPLLLRYETYKSAKGRQKILDELAEKIKRSL